MVKTGKDSRGFGPGSRYVTLPLFFVRYRGEQLDCSQSWPCLAVFQVWHPRNVLGNFQMGEDEKGVEAGMSIIHY